MSIIQISDLCKRFDGRAVLDHISLSINEGEIMMIIGASGVGKTVLLHHLIGLMQPTGGSIRIEGQEIVGLREREMQRIRKGIGFMFQGGALFDFMSVHENLALPLREHTTMGEGAIAERVRSVLEEVDLGGVGHLMPAELSGGMRKRVGLARALIMQPRIVLCDEPTSGLDPVRRTIINNLIARCNKQRGITMVVTSHDVPSAIDMADRVAMLHGGRIVAVAASAAIRDLDNDVVRHFICGKPLGEDDAP
jgi:phospholipid/cholesterol/gamma-HCH transport system ATP-binding protein